MLRNIINKNIYLYHNFKLLNLETEKVNLKNNSLILINDLNMKKEIKIENFDLIFREHENNFKLAYAVQVLSDHYQRGVLEDVKTYREICDLLSKKKLQYKNNFSQRLSIKYKKFFSKIKYENLQFFLQKKEKSFFKIRDDIITHVLNEFDRLNKDLNINENCIYQHVLENVFFNFKDFQNIILFSNFENTLTKEDKENYPLSIINNEPNLDLLISGRELTRYSYLTDQLEKRINSKKNNNFKVESCKENILKYGFYSEWNIYCLLSMNMVFDFLIKFRRFGMMKKQGNIKNGGFVNIPLNKLNRFIGNQVFLTIEAIFIIDVLLNWKIYSDYISKSKSKIEGFCQSGINLDIKELRKYKNTFFDLSDIILSSILNYSKDFKVGYLTGDSGIKLFNDWFLITKTQKINCFPNISKGSSILNKFQSIRLYENIMLEQVEGKLIINIRKKAKESESEFILSSINNILISHGLIDYKLKNNFKNKDFINFLIKNHTFGKYIVELKAIYNGKDIPWKYDDEIKEVLQGLYINYLAKILMKKQKYIFK